MINFIKGGIEPSLQKIILRKVMTIERSVINAPIAIKMFVFSRLTNQLNLIFFF